ncbi:unnamed protein product [Ilex paraguariensis]|uniref:Uncharacterized protein n=1 Tax=Ilex paraguariensis TaxID=185542 RepID=A0ABC8R674_9AQUA
MLVSFEQGEFTHSNSHAGVHDRAKHCKHPRVPNPGGVHFDCLYRGITAVSSRESKLLAGNRIIAQVRVYDLASMSCSYVLAGHTVIVLCLDTCVTRSGGTLIATGSKDNSVRLWDSESRSCIGVGIGHNGAIAFSKSKRNFFVSGSSDRTLKVWSLDSLADDAEEASNLKAKAVVAAHDKDINSLAVAPNDSLVCSGSQDRTACLWPLPDLVFLVALKGHKRGIWSVEFSPVDQCVITASGDKTIKIWAISDGSCLKTFEGHTSSVTRASFITRGIQFVSCGNVACNCKSGFVVTLML